jgi:hypothetical protein
MGHVRLVWRRQCPEAAECCNRHSPLAARMRGRAACMTWSCITGQSPQTWPAASQRSTVLHIVFTLSVVRWLNFTLMRTVEVYKFNTLYWKISFLAPKLRNLLKCQRKKIKETSSSIKNKSCWVFRKGWLSPILFKRKSHPRNTNKNYRLETQLFNGKPMKPYAVFALKQMFHQRPKVNKWKMD